MTLILSTIYKNGICVCADKRNVEFSRVTNNNLYKIYPFKKIPLIIYNHGVNKFNNKMWNEYCLEYEKRNKWIHYKFIGICGNFKKFIEGYIHQELKRNFRDGLPREYTKSSFVFCGKTGQDAKFKIRELSWSFGSNGFELQSENKGKITLSGKGEKCLKTYLDKNRDIFTNEYWENLDKVKAKEELEKLFSVAVKEKNKSCDDTFSDDFDMVCM